MNKKIFSVILVLFLSSILISAYGATDNVIIRVGYPRLGENQNVGTVRIYESDATIDSIQKGDIFTIFVENAEFMSPATLVERGRFDLKIVSGGNDGDSYITYEFIPASSGDTGRVVIDFEFDNMRVTGGDVTARVDSIQSGVTSSYFSLGGSEKEKKDREEKVIEEEIIITSNQLKEALEKDVNILIQNNDYQVLIGNKILKENKLQEIIEKDGNLKVNIRREEPSEIKYLTDIYFFSFTTTDKKGNELEKIKDFTDTFNLIIKDKNIKDKSNVKGVSIKDFKNQEVFTHYDKAKDNIIVMVKDFKDGLTLIRGSNNRELIFKDEDYREYNGKKYIPIRKSASYYNWDVTWNPYTRTVNLEKDGKEIEITDYIIIKERSYISAEFFMDKLQVPVFILENQIVLKYY